MGVHLGDPGDEARAISEHYLNRGPVLPFPTTGESRRIDGQPVENEAILPGFKLFQRSKNLIARKGMDITHTPPASLRQRQELHARIRVAAFLRNIARSNELPEHPADA
ncbi:hypothetical protein [Rhodobacter sp. 24-YEA-8]|uniref:hypothetical protein n=1 Tax=Rhodobacter sp. 24-YEA-8 TaxID=1884310 RepID=UPI00209B4935|nr:hypothetical protein [Rhodobacter sp. 24-YEA-8]